MTDWQDRADEAITHNIADVMENGPRLAWTRKTAALAIDREHKFVLLTGLGALGVGTMWCSYAWQDAEDPEWVDLPEQDSTGEFGNHRDTDAAWKMPKGWKP